MTMLRITCVSATARAVVFALLCLPALSRAEPTLRYDYHYACNQEHIVVARCRKDSDTPDMPPTTPEDDYCQLYYPDRPKTGGFTAMGTMLRADVIKTLRACGAFDATGVGSSGQARAAPQGSTTAQPPARTGAPGTQSAERAKMHKQFCDKILQLRSAAPQGFRSIDLGPQKGESAEFHGASIQLPGVDGDCFIKRDANEPPYYLCSWTVLDASGENYDEARINETSNLLASCLNARADWTTKNGADSMDIRSAGVDYSLYTVAGELQLTVQAAQPSRSNAPSGNPAAPPPPSPAAVPPGGAAAAPPDARPAIKPMPIGPAMCPLLRRLEALAHEDFRSIDLGPDRTFGKDAGISHRTSIHIPPARCYVDHSPDMPVTYACMWPQSEDKVVDDQFVKLGRALEQCTGGTLDLSMLEFGDVSVRVRGVEFRASIVGVRDNNDFMSLDVHRAQP